LVVVVPQVRQGLGIVIFFRFFFDIPNIVVVVVSVPVV
jgi:hypothetical protein